MTHTRQPELTLERFEALVAAYGGELERFPERERARACALVLRSRDARRMLEAARALDAVLTSARAAVGPRAALESRLARIPELHAQERPLIALLPFRSRTRAFVAAAAAMLLGIAGSRVVPEEPSEATTAAVDAADVGSLAFADELFEELMMQEGELE